MHISIMIIQTNVMVVENLQLRAQINNYVRR